MCSTEGPERDSGSCSGNVVFNPSNKPISCDDSVPWPPAPRCWPQGVPSPRRKGWIEVRLEGFGVTTGLCATPHIPTKSCLQHCTELSVMFYYPTPKLTNVVLPPPSSPHSQKNKEENKKVGDEARALEWTGRPGDPQHPNFCSLLQLRCSWGSGGPLLCTESDWWGGSGRRDVGSDSLALTPRYCWQSGAHPPAHRLCSWCCPARQGYRDSVLKELQPRRLLGGRWLTAESVS